MTWRRYRLGCDRGLLATRPIWDKDQTNRARPSRQPPDSQTTPTPGSIRTARGPRGRPLRSSGAGPAGHWRLLLAGALWSVLAGAVQGQCSRPGPRRPGAGGETYRQPPMQPAASHRRMADREASRSRSAAPSRPGSWLPLERAGFAQWWTTSEGWRYSGARAGCRRSGSAAVPRDPARNDPTAPLAEWSYPRSSTAPWWKAERGASTGCRSAASPRPPSSSDQSKGSAAAQSGAGQAPLTS